MVELVDTQDLKSCDGNVVRVQVPFGVLKLKRIKMIRFFHFMMYIVYAISSINRNYIYVGLTSNLDARILRHNLGYEKTTKPYSPFMLIYTEVCTDRISARKREKYFKSGVGKEFLRNLRDQGNFNET
jgi:putative endonuclease